VESSACTSKCIERNRQLHVRLERGMSDHHFHLLRALSHVRFTGTAPVWDVGFNLISKKRSISFCRQPDVRTFRQSPHQDHFYLPFTAQCLTTTISFKYSGSCEIYILSSRTCGCWCSRLQAQGITIPASSGNLLTIHSSYTTARVPLRAYRVRLWHWRCCTSRLPSHLPPILALWHFLCK
jgi:hypothetical protein